MIKAFIFDSDGVLVDTEAVNEQAYFEVVQKAGITPLTSEEYKEYSGLTGREFLQRVLEKRGVDKDPASLAKEKTRRAIELLSQKDIPVFEGVRELLSALKDRGLKIGVATSASKERAQMIFSETGLGKAVDVIVTGGDIRHGKPNPEIFLLAAERLQIQPEEVIVIEDATAGVEAAKTAGMFCIGKDNHVGQDLTKADLIVESLTELDLDQLLS
ncbi:MAG TPA: HAD family phosphatase [candidate division CPR3 bacterium]|uniref:HAD family phosphatase n=1 Tax=candidate division CPR3 bacterium TaxID=2268181 RepID=A0A7C1NJV9_UNCC3|nr:HAD family phosphatase [candidate division CPR3 bacterium]